MRSCRICIIAIVLAGLMTMGVRPAFSANREVEAVVGLAVVLFVCLALIAFPYFLLTKKSNFLKFLPSFCRSLSFTVCLCTVIMTLIGIYPPWVEEVRYSGGLLRVNAGYALLFFPPEPARGPLDLSTGLYLMTLDLSRLIVEWIMGALICAALMFFAIRRYQHTS